MLTRRGRPFTLAVVKPVDPRRLDPGAARATYALAAFVERVLPAPPDADLA